MIVLVCGGRDFDDADFIWTELMKLHLERGPFTKIIHGDCDAGRNRKSADKIAGEWAIAHGIEVKSYPVSKETWLMIGKKAGPGRNQYMLNKENPRLTIAFPGGSGTADMVRKSKKAGVEVIKVTR